MNKHGLKIGDKGLRKISHDRWVEFTVNETYLSLIAEFPKYYKHLIRKKMKNPRNIMSPLSDRGWFNQQQVIRTDAFDTYSKKINDCEIIVSKYTKSSKWECVLIEFAADGRNDEITINYDATFDWVVSLEKLLSKT